MTTNIFNVDTCTHEELVHYLCGKRFYIKTQSRFGIRPEDENKVCFYVDEEDPEGSAKNQMQQESRYGLTAPDLAEMYHRHKPNPEFCFTWCSLPDMDLVYKLLYRHITLMSVKINTSLRSSDTTTEEELSILDEFIRFLHPRVSYRVQQLYDKETLNKLNLPKPKSHNPFKRPSRHQHKEGQRIKMESKKEETPSNRSDEYQSPISPTQSTDSFANRISRWSRK